MLKKIFYFGLGLVTLFYENFDELARAGEERFNQQATTEIHPSERIVEIATKTEDVKPDDQSNRIDSDDIETDDLTKISGIGPAFAGRLQEAGITTYQELAGLTAEQVRDITQAADWQGDPENWIAQAKTMT